VLAIVREVPWGKGMAGRAPERAEPGAACKHQTDTSGAEPPRAPATRLQGAIVVPMMRGAEVVGTLGVGCLGERTFTPEETRWLLDLARRAAETLPPE
jgi:hypothetical protein